MLDTILYCGRIKYNKVRKCCEVKAMNKAECKILTVDDEKELTYIVTDILKREVDGIYERVKKFLGGLTVQQI